MKFQGLVDALDCSQQADLAVSGHLCLPPRRHAPQIREPTAAVFSAESMLRGMGVPLTWSLARPLPGSVVAGRRGGYVDVEMGPQDGNDLLRVGWGRWGGS